LVLGRRPLGAILHSSNEPGELSQWLCHDDSTINIVVLIIIITVLEGIMEGLRHQGRPRRQWILDIEEWTGCERRCHKIEHNGEERYRSGRLLSPTLIEEG